MSVIAQTARDSFFNGDWLDAVLDVFLGSMGALWVAIICFGILGALYIDADDLVLPAVVAMILGGLVVEYAPPQVSQVGVLIIVLTAALVAAKVYYGGPTRR